ncbi:MAG: hypothetical protein CUN54_08745 [Phototrophicales bacterium]|nr:MAG: hypothetical protein CUN54_08745 [Phototrophicales bacterium]
MEPRNEELIWEGNRRLLRFEQEDVLQEAIYNGNSALWKLAEFDLSVDFDSEGIPARYTINSPVPGTSAPFPSLTGNFSNFDDRWEWITSSILPDWRAYESNPDNIGFINEQLGDICNLPIGIDIISGYRNSPLVEIFSSDLSSVDLQSGDLFDLIFVIDTTGSMADDIDAVKREAVNVINAVAASGNDWRIGIVTYRDHGPPYGVPNDAYVSNEELPFSSNASEITNAINAITVRQAGGDEAEAVFSGLMTAIEFPWRDGAQKVIILMGDAPPHDPEPVTGFSQFDVLRAAFEVDPANVYPILIENNRQTRNAFQALADGTSGRLFNAQASGEVVDVLIETIQTATGETRLAVGELARAETMLADALRLREGPGTDFDIIDLLVPGSVVTIIGGPEFVDPHIWWQVRSPRGVEGWSVEADDGEITLFRLTEEEAAAVPEDQCLAIAPGLTNMRAGPGTNNARRGQLQEGDIVRVIGRSTSGAGFIWWQLENGNWVRDDVVGLIGDCSIIR